MKAQVPEEVLKAARQMNRKAYEERLREIKYVYVYSQRPKSEHVWISDVQLLSQFQTDFQTERLKFGSH